MIHFDHISKTLGNNSVVQDFSLKIKTGEAVCICGPSGIGKTTLLEIGAGLLSPDSGMIIRDSDSIGCAFQDDLLVPWLTAIENIELTLAALPDKGKATARKWITRFDLPATMIPTKMSGGMRRRLCLARAFAVSPRILLLDEPFAFLDEVWQHKVATLIEEHRQKDNAVLLVSHQLRHLETFQCRKLKIPSGPITTPEH